MKATRCPHCNLLTSEGEYDNLKIAPTGIHYAIEIDGFALPAESPNDRDETTGELPCSGSELLGRVVEA